MNFVREIKAQNTSQNESSVVGVLMGATDSHIPLVSFPGLRGLTQAKSALNEVDCSEISAFPVNVLIVFEGGDQSKPVVAAIVRNNLFPIGRKTELTQKSRSSELNATVDGKAININAQDEIRLECGKSSILLRKDGKVVIKGANLISRSSGPNKIKGGSVGIN